MCHRGWTHLLNTLNVMVYISLLSLGCFFIHQGNVVQRFQERKTNFAKQDELVTEMPTIVTWPSPVDWKLKLLLGENYFIIFEYMGKETVLTEGYNKHSSGTIHVEVKYNLWQNRIIRITPMNFSSIPHYFSVKYKFENEISSDYNVSTIGVKLTSRNNSHCGYGFHYFDGDETHSSKPTGRYSPEDLS